jgi:long-chain fatty acid transport protein
LRESGREERLSLRWARAATGCALLLFAAAVPARGQGSEDVNAGQFDFSLPGARSLAIGGAFIALADDATSAYSNPAGLIQLGRPEISVEYRGWNFDATAIDRGHAFGQPTGIGLDTISGLVSEAFPSSTAGVSFASLVYPKSRWALGLFAHRFPKFETTKDIQGAFFNCSGGTLEEDTGPYCQSLIADTNGIDRVQPKDQDIKIGLWSAGATLSFKLRPGLSLGFSGLYYSFAMDSTNRVYSTFADPFGPKNRDHLDLFATQRGDDHAFAWNGGFRWSLGYWVVAGAYRRGPRFDYTNTIRAGPWHRQKCPDDLCNVHQVRFKVPDTFAGGVAFRPSPPWTLTFQYDFVEFSDLMGRQSSGLQGNAARTLEAGLKTDNVHRFRFGAEYLKLFSGGQVVALRGGVWHGTSHRTFFEADPETGLPYPQYALLFPKGPSQTHGSAGIGFVLQPHFQLDAAVDISDMYRTVSVSTILKF